jgi:hypothetical protein
VGEVSLYFQLNETTLWNPSIKVGLIFKGEADVIASAFGIPSGLSDVVEDDCQVNLPVFETFIAEMVRQLDRTNHPILLSLTTGFVGSALALIERAGGKLPESEPGRAAEWAELSADAARSMPV